MYPSFYVSLNCSGSGACFFTCHSAQGHSLLFNHISGQVHFEMSLYSCSQFTVPPFIFFFFVPIGMLLTECNRQLYYQRRSKYFQAPCFLSIFLLPACVRYQHPHISKILLAVQSQDNFIPWKIISWNSLRRTLIFHLLSVSRGSLSINDTMERNYHIQWRFLSP